MTPTLPARVVLRLVEAALREQERSLDKRLRHNPRGNPTGHAAEVLRREIATCQRQQKAVWQLTASEPKGQVRADLAALLAAWAIGHTSTLPDLETLLAGEKHPAADAIAELHSEDIAAACRLLVGG